MHRFLFLPVLLLTIAGVGVGLFFVFSIYPVVSPLHAEETDMQVSNDDTVASLGMTRMQSGGHIGPTLRSDAIAVPLITAVHAVVVDGETGSILYGKEERETTPIASLTKLMTALVVLDQHPDWNRRVAITARDAREGGALFVRTDDVVTVRDLFFASLVGSANNATMALARSTGFSDEEFVSAMNAMARRLGLSDTVFVEQTGLDPGNQSTAQDIARLAWHAFQNEMIHTAVTTPEYIFRTLNTKQRHRVKNTDQLLRTNGRAYTIIGGKTGFIHEAGFCLVVEAVRGNAHVIALVLGSTSQEDRFTDVDALIKWALESYTWDTEGRKN